MTWHYGNLYRLRQSRAITPDMFETARCFYEACEGKETWPGRVIMALGGFNSPGGSCLWHVVVRGVSLRKWCLNICMVEQSYASGILFGALSALPTIRGMVGDGRHEIWCQKVNVRTSYIPTQSAVEISHGPQALDNPELTGFVHEVGER